MSPEKGLHKVLAKAGGATAIAAACGAGVKRQNVEYWIKRLRLIPSEHCPALERAFGIPCESQRGDLRWVRVPDANWPDGKPLLDVAAHAA